MLELLPLAHDAEIPPPRPRDALADELASLWAQTDGLGPDLWTDAGMPELVHYLLGAKGLNVPARWEWSLLTSKFHIVPSHKTFWTMGMGKKKWY